MKVGERLLVVSINKTGKRKQKNKIELPLSLKHPKMSCWSGRRYFLLFLKPEKKDHHDDNDKNLKELSAEKQQPQTKNKRPTNNNRKNRGKYKYS
jgi:hypothetical protein